MPLVPTGTNTHVYIFLHAYTFRQYSLNKRSTSPIQSLYLRRMSTLLHDLAPDCLHIEPAERKAAKHTETPGELTRTRTRGRLLHGWGVVPGTSFENACTGWEVPVNSRHSNVSWGLQLSDPNSSHFIGREEAKDSCRNSKVSHRDTRRL